MRCCAPGLLAIAISAAPGAVCAYQSTPGDRRLMEIHSLLLDLPPMQAPAALPNATLALSLEAVTIPFIDGNVDGKHEITASDHTRIFPRPRLMLGLPAPAGLRAFVGLSYIPPIRIRQASTDDLAGEAGVGGARGRLLLGARVHALYATSRAPVTDPATVDILRTWEYGADASAGVRLGVEGLAIEPYAGIGVVSLRGRFRVTVDGTVLRTTYTGAALHAGVRLALRSRWEIVTEVDGYPGRLVHTDVRIGYLLGW